jgi:hypothetical protein
MSNGDRDDLDHDDQQKIAERREPADQRDVGVRATGAGPIASGRGTDLEALELLVEVVAQRRLDGRRVAPAPAGDDT